MDGKLLDTMAVETKPSKLVYFDPFSEEQMRLYLPEGDHVFRAGFMDDDFVKGLTDKDAYDDKKNKFIDSITFVGPYPSKVGKAQPQEDPDLRSEPAPACVEKIVANLAHHAYRRPVTKAEVASLMKFVAMAKAQRPIHRAGHPTGARGHAGLAAISSSASSTTPTPPIRPRRIRISDSNWPRA